MRAWNAKTTNQLMAILEILQGALIARSGSSTAKWVRPREPFLEIEYQAAVPDTGPTAALLGVGVFVLLY